jgi:titin
VTGAAPNAPSDLSLTIDGGVYVRWTDNSTDETGFEIERAVQIPAVAGETAFQQDLDFERIGTVGPGGQEFYDDAPPAGRLTYRVRACGTGGCSDYTPPASIDYVAPPVVSTALAAQITTQTAVLQGSVDPRGSSTMAWFEYDDNPGLTSPLTTLKVSVGAAAGAQSFSQFVDGLSQGVAYYFRIRASNPGGETSGAIETFTTLTPPIAPSGVTLSYNESIGVDVRWSDNSDNETYFEIEREFVSFGAPGQDANAAAAVYVSVGTVPANTTFFHDVSPPDPAELNYRVRACHSSGCSAYSPPNKIFYGGS